jgi:hypothetical protein
MDSQYQGPLFPVSEMAAIIPADTKKSFDIRQVRPINYDLIQCSYFFVGLQR